MPSAASVNLKKILITQPVLQFTPLDAAALLMNHGASSILVVSTNHAINVRVACDGFQEVVFVVGLNRT